MPATNTRNIRATQMWFVKETTATVAVTPVGTDAVQILTGLDVQPDFAMVDREINKPFLGTSPKLSSRQLLKASGLRVELGVGGTSAPGWENILLACGFAAATLTSPARREYTPVSTNFASGTGWFEGAGVLYKSRGMLGNGTMDFSVGNVPRFEGELTGMYIEEVAGSGPTADYTAWKTPQVVQPAVVGSDVTFGCTYAAGALSGGTAFASKGLRIEIGNSVSYEELCTNPFMNIGERSMKASVTMDMSAAQEVAAVLASRDGTLDSMGFKFGVGTGKQILIFCPAVQRMNPKVVPGQSGVRLLQFDLDLTPSVGNDEFRMVVL